MPSRRTVPRTVSALTFGSFAGCTQFFGGVDGYVQLKSIAGRYSGSRRQTEVSILRVTLSSPPGAEPPSVTYLHDDWEAEFDSPRTPVISDDLHGELQRAYETIRYVVGVCSPSWAKSEDESVGCYNVATTRKNFNRVQVHDHVEASSDGTFLTIHSVEGDWTFSSE